MKIYNLSTHTKGIIFDIDSTLYTNAAYAYEQVDIQIRHLAHLRGIDCCVARNMIKDWRDRWSCEHGGQKISLGNTLLHFGVPITESIEWRKMLLEPKHYLTGDERLAKCLTELNVRMHLICVTNNPVLPARKTLEALGVANIIEDIVGLDTCGESKPARRPFALALDTMGITAAEAVSVGDRYDLDIALPLKMGMGGILVGGVEEVYTLTRYL